MTGRRLLLPGATSMIGHRVLPMLEASGWHVIGVSRQVDVPPGPAAHWVTPGQRLPAVDAVLSLMPVWALPELLEGLAVPPPRRVVALSSTSVLAKQYSEDSAERLLVHRLQSGERGLQEWCGRTGVDWVLLRPTLVYGAGLDRNIATIARLASRMGCFPVVGGGNGLRQPVHVDDVAAACVASLEAPTAPGNTYALSGGETLTYAEMVARIMRAAGRTPRVLSVPRWLARRAVSCLRMLPRYRGYSPFLVDRMVEDLVFDHEAARLDLGFEPRAFHPEQQDVGRP